MVRNLSANSLAGRALSRLIWIMLLSLLTLSASANGTTTNLYTAGFQDTLQYTAPALTNYYAQVGPTGIRPGSGTYNYTYLLISADTTGIYTFETTANTQLSSGVDTMLFLYSSFDASQPTNNALAGDDDYYVSSTHIQLSKFTNSLTAGVTNTVVITSWRAGDKGTVELSITGPGVITFYNTAPQFTKLINTNAAWDTLSLLAPAVGAIDVQLLSTNGGNGDYAGSTLTIARQGGASTNDNFAISTTNASFSISGSDLQYSNLTFATWSTNANTLQLAFTSSGTNATHALVQNVLRHILYQNPELGPVTLEWTFDDGNLGDQGVGGDLSITSTQLVSVVKRVPVISPWPTATGISVGDQVGASTLQNGTSSTPGTFAFANPTYVPSLGSYSASVIFTPTDTTYYSNVTNSVSVAVGKKSQTIDFATIGNQITTATVTLGATATSDLSVSYSVVSGPAQITGGNVVSFTGAGTVTIAADQAGDGTWLAAPQVTRTFSVGWAAPVIVTQPRGVDAVVGGQAKFSMQVTGASPLQYQWRWNGSPIESATNAVLTLSGLAQANSGDIDAVVKNPYGSATSQVARLTVSIYTIWGDNRYGQSSAVNSPATPIAAALGWFHDVSLLSDGTVHTWGDNHWGQTNTPAGLASVVAVSAGAYHSIALKADGTVMGWGWGLIGQTNVPAGLTNAVAISAGGFHNLALKADGTVVGWGYDYYGQCAPPPGLTGVKAIAAGSYHSLALLTNGTVVAWGNNTLGQCDVPGGLGAVTGIVAGAYHNLVILSDGTVTGWGDNRYLQLNTPAGLDGVVKLASGISHALALKADGTVVSWGHNQWLQTEVPEGLTNVKDIAAGGDHSIVILQLP